MSKSGLLWRVFGSYLLVIGLLGAGSLAALRVTLVDSAVDAERTRLAETARHEASRAPTPAGDASGVLARAAEEHPHLGFRFFDREGNVVAASRDAERRSSRPTPDVVAALREGREASRIFHSLTAGEEVLAVAVPVTVGDEVVGAIQVTRPVGAVRQAAVAGWKSLFVPVGASVALACVVALFLAIRFTRPIEVLRRGAEQFGRGNLKRKVPTPPGVELGELADALNQMASQLSERIDEITNQRNERQAVLESMAEGVLAVDGGERVLSINRAAQELLGIPARDAAGRLVQETSRNVALQRLIARALKGDFSTECEEGSYIRTGSETVLLARCAPLRDGGGRDIGVVTILTNVTRLQKLENLRREFVANVSHELRTPITSIKGFTETLLDGALENPEEAERFVRIIARQSDRLCDVIEDLLSLSRLDRHERIETEDVSLAKLIGQSADFCRDLAAKNAVELDASCPEDLRLRVNPVLVEQALTNLIENAVKYSKPGGGKVAVEVERNGSTVRIHVRDNGVGIEKEHLERVFERFYRIDKARSREVGGTGLGLSIVKNVAQVHGGSVSVSSTPGEGTDFSVTLPLGAGAENITGPARDAGPPNGTTHGS